MKSLKKIWLVIRRYGWLLLVGCGAVLGILFALPLSLPKLFGSKPNNTTNRVAERVGRFKTKTWEIDSRTKLELDALRKDSKEEHEEIKAITRIKDGSERRAALADRLKGLK